MTFLKSGYVTLPTALCNAIRGMPSDSAAEITFGYAEGIGPVAAAKIADARTLAYLDRTDANGVTRSKPISVRGTAWDNAAPAPQGKRK